MINETGTKPVSAVFDVGMVDGVNNMYAFVGKQTVSPEYVLAIVMVGENAKEETYYSTELFVIKKATAGQLNLVMMGDKEEDVGATIKNGSFWPY